MLYLYTGTDREKARAKMNADIAKDAKKDAHVLRINDAHATEDLRAALRGGGMFAERRILVFEGVCLNEEMREMLLTALPVLSDSAEDVFIYEEKPLADLRKKLEKHAERTERFDAPKKERDSGIFAVANALRNADKKALWVSYMKEIAKGSAPEAIHGVLFWGAKDALMKAGSSNAREKKLVAQLAALPHEARRRGEDMEYALERFILCV
jgi:hypothetical protein